MALPGGRRSQSGLFIWVCRGTRQTGSPHDREDKLFVQPYDVDTRLQIKEGFQLSWLVVAGKIAQSIRHRFVAGGTQSGVLAHGKAAVYRAFTFEAGKHKYNVES